MSHQAAIREEELKNCVAAMFFGKYDCARIVGNIDFCVSPKRRDPRQMMFIPDTPILWAEAKNHSTDIYRMLAQLILTIKGEQKCGVEPPRFVGCFDNEKIAFVEYHYVLHVFNLNDFNWTQTPSAVDVNHWIPFTEEEVGAKDCFKSHFMSDFINGTGELPAHHSIGAVARDARPYQTQLELSATPQNPVNPVNPVEKTLRASPLPGHPLRGQPSAGGYASLRERNHFPRRPRRSRCWS